MRSRPRTMVLVILAVLSGACAKKHSRVNETPVQEPFAPQAAAEPTPTVTPPPPQPAALDPLAGDLASINRYVQEQGLLGDVLFEYDRHELTEEARRRLEANARFLKDSPQFRVALEGHADERGTVEYNLALGQKRAGTARSFLDGMGVSSERLRALTYGEERPVCTEPSENCWHRNRRVHFEIVERIE